MAKQAKVVSGLEHKQSKQMSELARKLDRHNEETCKKEFDIPLVSLDYEFMNCVDHARRRIGCRIMYDIS